MKVLFVIHQFYPQFGAGTEAVTLSLAKMLQLAGHKVKVVCYRPGQADSLKRQCGKIRWSEEMVGTIPVTGFCHEEFPSDLNYAFENPDTLAFAGELLDREQPDIIHFTHLMRTAPFIPAAAERNIPYIVTLTDFMTICPRVNLTDVGGKLCEDCGQGTLCADRCSENLDYVSRTAQAKKLLSEAELVTAPSEFVSSRIRKELGINVEVFPHGIERPASGTVQEPHSGKLQLGFVGNLAEHKGIETLLSAFTGADMQNAELHIYGTGNDDYVEKLHSLAGSSDSIFWHGQKSHGDILAAYRGFDALIVPSVCVETYSMAKNEARVCGLPVIVSNLGALPDNVSDGRDGFVFDPFEENGLTAVLKRIDDNPGLLRAMKKEAASLFIPTVEQEAFRYLSVYLDIIGR